MMRVKSGVLFNIGLRSLKNEVLNKFSRVFNTCLHAPPNVLDVRMTMRCNLRCKQCRAWAWEPKEELSTDAWKRVFSEIRNYIGPYFIRFYGGEPFCRSDLLELINFCSKKDILSLITTNGTFVDEVTASELAKNQIALINISLDGMSPETHDRLRGVKGTHLKVMRAIEILQGKIPIQIDATIMNDNLDEIPDFAEFAYKNRIPVSFQGFINTAKLDDSLGSRLFPEDSEKASYIIDELIRRKRYNDFIVNTDSQLRRLKAYYQNPLRFQKQHCGAIYNNHLIIKEEGDVCICAFFKPIGNLAENSLRDIWNSELAGQMRKEMKECGRTSCSIIRCYNCESWREKWHKAQRLIWTKP